MRAGAAGAAGAPLRFTPELERRIAGAPLVVMLDVDGTLAPIAPRPEDAAVPLETRRAVAALAAREDVHVALVSGRAAADARRLVGVANTWVVGNHGIEVESPEGETTVEPQVAGYAGAVAQAARRLTTLLEHVAGVLVENKRWTLSVHYRLADPGVLPRLKAVVEEVAREHGLRATTGKMVFELRPPVRVDKGTAVLSLALRLGALDERASLLFAGDDQTDEDAFRLLRARVPRAVTVHVAGEAPRATAAEFTVAGPGALRAVLEWLAERR